MATLTEGAHNRDFLVSIAGQRSLETISLASGEHLAAGAVLGLQDRRQAALPIPAVTGTGTGLMSALTAGPAVKVGSYTITCTTTASGGGVFSVVDPDGIALGSATVGAAFKSDHLNFLISDGNPDFMLGDHFHAIVTAGGVPTIIGTGSGVMSGISLGAEAQRGTYTVTVQDTSGTSALTVIAPDGSALPDGVIDAAYTSAQINFTVADGGTMTVGDTYHLIVATGPDTAVAWNSAAVDGSQRVAGILLDATDAALAITAAVMLARDAEVNADELVWRTGYTAGQQARGLRGLRDLGIIARATDGAY